MSEAAAFASLPYWIVIPKMKRNGIVILIIARQVGTLFRNWFLEFILNEMMFFAMKKQPFIRSSKHLIAWKTRMTLFEQKLVCEKKWN